MSDELSDERMVVIAFACVPGRGSEPGAGWEIALAAADWGRAREVEVVVVTRSVGRELIRAEEVSSAVDWVFIDLPSWLDKALGGPASRAYFAVWQIAAVVAMRRRGGRGLVHLATYATDCVPPLALMLGRKRGKRIWGPIGSTHVAWRRGVAIRLKSVWQHLLVNAGALGVGNLVFQNEHSCSRLRMRRVAAAIRPNVVVGRELAEVPRYERMFARQLICVTNLVPGKGVEMALSALTRTPSDVGLVVVGDGPCRPSLERLARALGVANRVSFRGRLDRREALGNLNASDCLVHLSEHESAGWSVGEALSLGVPAVVFAGSGADTVVKMSEGNGRIVVSADLGAIANEVLTALGDGRGAPSARWSRERLREDLFEIYDRAITSS